MGSRGTSLRQYLLTRILLVVPMVFILLTLVFLLMRVIPGDPVSASLGGRVPQEEVDRIREELGYNRPILEQYVDYLADVVRGDFGVATTDNRKITDIVFDNGSLLSTGGFVSHTASGRTDLAAVARAAGCPRVLEAQTLFQFMEAVAEAFAADEMTTIVAKVEAVGPDRYHMDLALPENAFRFRRAVSAAGTGSH